MFLHEGEPPNNHNISPNYINYQWRDVKVSVKLLESIFDLNQKMATLHGERYTLRDVFMSPTILLKSFWLLSLLIFIGFPLTLLNTIRKSVIDTIAIMNGLLHRINNH